MAIRIVSKRDGFWRCGKQHKAEPVIWPDESFSSEELQRLMADDTLDVTIVPDPKLEDAGTPENPAPNPEADGTPFATDKKGNGLTIDEMSAAKLKSLAEQMGMEPFKNNTSKVKMIAAIEAYIEEHGLGEDDPPIDDDLDDTGNGGADDKGADGDGKTEDSGEPPTE